MQPTRPGARPLSPAATRRLLPAVLALAPLCAACHDSPVDPLASITTVETIPSLAISTPLPSLPELASRAPLARELGPALELWSNSWEAEDGEAARVEARATAVPTLYASLGETSARSALTSLRWLRVEGDLGEGLPASLADPLQEALALLDRGELALAEGKGEEALGWALAASDRVRSVTTQAVARRMVRRGEELLARDHAPGLDVERAVHLMNGARRALDEGEYALAVQRAFYACQVLEGPWTTDPETGDREPPAAGAPGAAGGSPR